MDEEKTPPAVKDRKLGDEWLDWDGGQTPESFDSSVGLFLGFAGLVTVLLILAGGAMLWLIYPRLTGMGHLVTTIVTLLFFTCAAILILWALLFTWSTVTGRPITRFLVIPRLINRLLSMVSAMARPLGIPTDRLTNSFLKAHNTIIGARPLDVPAAKLLVLAPRCLTKENHKRLREMRDRYGFEMATVGGGSQARLKIREVRPELVVAMACERDLLSGFKEVNVHVPVLAFPNRRPEGPCKNTCVDMDQIERMILRCLRHSDRAAESPEDGS